MFQQLQMQTQAEHDTGTCLKGECGAAETDVFTLMNAVKQEFEEISPIMGEYGGINLRPPPEGRRTYSAPGGDKDIGEDEFSNGIKLRTAYVAEMLGAEKHVRKALLARLAEAKIENSQLKVAVKK